MVRLFYNIWPFATIKISPIMAQFCQNRLSILANRKYTVKNLPRTSKLLPKWQNFAKSGHTGHKLPTFPPYETHEEHFYYLTSFACICFALFKTRSFKFGEKNLLRKGVVMKNR